MLGYVFCTVCGVAIPPFGPDTCQRCELDRHVIHTRIREQRH